MNGFNNGNAREGDNRQSLADQLRGVIARDEIDARQHRCAQAIERPRSTLSIRVPDGAGRGGKEKVEVGRGDLRMILTDAPEIVTSEMGGQVVAIIGPIGQHTSHPELQDALGLVCMAFNRRHGRLSATKHAKLAEARLNKGGIALLTEALEATRLRSMA